MLTVPCIALGVALGSGVGDRVTDEVGVGVVDETTLLTLQPTMPIPKAETINPKIIRFRYNMVNTGYCVMTSSLTK